MIFDQMEEQFLSFLEFSTLFNRDILSVYKIQKINQSLSKTILIQSSTMNSALSNQIHVCFVDYQKEEKKTTYTT